MANAGEPPAAISQGLILMAELGQKRTLTSAWAMSALPPKADIDQSGRDVRFVPKADILRCGKECRYSIPLSARTINTAAR